MASGEKVLYLCSQCQALFTQASQLKEHKAKCHAEAESPVKAGEKRKLEASPTESPAPPPARKRGRPRKTPIITVIPSPSSSMEAITAGRQKRQVKKPSHLQDFIDVIEPASREDQQGEEQEDQETEKGVGEEEKPEAKETEEFDEVVEGADGVEESFITLEEGKDFVLSSDSRTPGRPRAENPPCEECGYQAPDVRARWRHAKTHAKEFACNLCDKRFARTHELEVHKLIHKGVKPHKCDLCEYETRHLNALKEHQRKHLGLVFRCEVEGCEFRSVYRRALEMHKKRHVGTRDHVCQECGYGTFDIAAFKRHLKTHSQTKEYRCELCVYRAHEKYSIYKHMLCKHLGQKKYHCDQCDFSTAYLSGLKTHLMTHLNVKPFQCSACPYASNMKDKVKRHVLQRHKGSGEIIDNCLRLKINADHFIQHEPIPPQALLQLVEAGHTDMVDVHTTQVPIHLLQGATSSECTTIYLAPAPQQPQDQASETATAEVKGEQGETETNVQPQVAAGGSTSAPSGGDSLVIHIRRDGEGAQPVISKVESAGHRPNIPMVLSVDPSHEGAARDETVVKVSEFLQMYLQEVEDHRVRSTSEDQSGEGQTPGVAASTSLPNPASGGVLTIPPSTHTPQLASPEVTTGGGNVQLSVSLPLAATGLMARTAAAAALKIVEFPTGCMYCLIGDSDV